MPLDNQERKITDPLVFNSIDDLQLNRRLKNVRKFGTQSMAYSAMQEGIKEFRHPSFKGFIAYSTAWGIDYVLSDPLTPKSEMLKATILFLEQHKQAVFCQISPEYATLLGYLKFTINGLGIEHMVSLREFKVSWRKRKCLKSYLSKLEKQDFYVFEYQADLKKIRAINDQWLRGRQNAKELKFMARPFVGIDEPDVRYFYLIKKSEVIGFCSFDPVYAADNTGEIRSYTLQHLRVSGQAPLGSQDYLILNALFQFKEEGFEKISLGLAPLSRRNHSGFDSSSFAEAVFVFLYQTSVFYNYKTIGQHKDHYKASPIQTYLASPKSFSLRQLCGLLKVNNLI